MERLPDVGRLLGVARQVDNLGAQHPVTAGASDDVVKLFFAVADAPDKLNKLECLSTSTLLTNTDQTKVRP